MLYVFVILSNARRRIVHFNVTDSPSAAWTGQQIVEAFPWDTAPRYMIRDRDKKYGDEFTRKVSALDIQQVLTLMRHKSSRFGGLSEAVEEGTVTLVL